RAGRKCIKELYVCTRDAVGWLAEAQRLQGTLDWLSGRPRRAYDHWQLSLATAAKTGMPLERGRTLLKMGVQMGEVPIVADACRVFEDIGAKVDLALALHALAHVAINSVIDREAALLRYDEAITHLDAVKAEYNLGLARRERAQLLIDLGRHDDARCDF